MNLEFLPISREDMRKQNIAQLDFVYVIGDAYVDHPSFGHAIISRLLQSGNVRTALRCWGNPDLDFLYRPETWILW